MTRTRTALLVFALAALLAAGCSDDDSSDGADTGTTDTSVASDGPTTTGLTTTTGGDDATTTTGGVDEVSLEAVVFNGEGNNLQALGTSPPFEAQQVITAAADDPENGRDINAQICF